MFFILSMIMISVILMMILNIILSVDGLFWFIMLVMFFSKVKFFDFFMVGMVFIFFVCEWKIFLIIFLWKLLNYGVMWLKFY